MGVYDETAIFIISDHGFSEEPYATPAQKKDFAFKNSDYISPLNVKSLSSYNPLLMFKNFNHRGDLQTKQRDVSLIDIAPTICSMISCKNNWEGVSLEHPAPKNRVYTYWIYHGGPDRFQDGYDRFFSLKSKYWKQVKASGPLSQLEDRLKEELLHPFSCKKKLLFSDSSHLSSFSSMGLSNLEPWGRWSNQKFVRISFFKDKNCDLKNIKFNLTAFVYDKKQTASVSINGKFVQTIQFEKGDNSKREYIFSILDTRSKKIEIQFKIFNPTSPQSLGLNNDTRLLGLGFIDMQLN